MGPNAIIEPVGACATLIWEEFQKSGLSDKISVVSANLIYTVLQIHTLNFNAPATSDRDRKAFAQIKKYTRLPSDWFETYYAQHESDYVRDPVGAVNSDSKLAYFPNLDLELNIAQAELWNGSEFIQKYEIPIKQFFDKQNHPYWFLTLASIKEGKNYLLSTNDKLKLALAKAVGIEFKGDIGPLNSKTIPLPEPISR